MDELYTVTLNSKGGMCIERNPTGTCCNGLGYIKHGGTRLHDEGLGMLLQKGPHHHNAVIAFLPPRTRHIMTEQSLLIH